MLQVLDQRPSVYLDREDIVVVLATSGNCYEHRRSGELVRACALPVAFDLPGHTGNPGDMLVADEYGGWWAMPPMHFDVLYRPSCICPY